MEKLREVSEELGRDYEFVISETPEEAQKALAGFRDKDYVITAIGGDGSINHVLNAIVGTKNILSFIPFGTGNDFCRTCVESMENGIHEVDIIRVNDRYCINVACFGIDADMANDDLFIHSKWIPRTMRFNASVVGHFLRYKKGRRLRIECKGKVREGYFATVIAANCRYYGSGYNVSPQSVTDDGMMEIFEVGSLPGIWEARVSKTIGPAAWSSPPTSLLRPIWMGNLTSPTGLNWKSSPRESAWTFIRMSSCGAGCDGFLFF